MFSTKDHSIFKKGLILFSVVTIIGLMGCSTTIKKSDPSYLKAMPLPPLKVINDMTCVFENEDLKITATRSANSSFYGSLMIENLKNTDVEILWVSSFYVSETKLTFPFRQAQTGETGGQMRNSIIPAGAAIKVDLAIIDRNESGTPFLPYYSGKDVWERSEDLYAADEAICCVYTLGLYNIITWPFKYSAAKKRANASIEAGYEREKLAINVYSGKTVMMRIPYTVGSATKKVELSYKLEGKIEPLTEVK